MGRNGGAVALQGEAARLLAGGHALVVATVAAVEEQAEPYATRGWGLTVLSEAPPSFRLILAVHDVSRFGPEPAGRPIAITVADPLTLRAVQFKGRAGPVEPATDADHQTVAGFCDSFFSAVTEADGTKRALLERLIPADFVACIVLIDQIYDQTPGPRAGSALPGSGGD
jgi:hypothetical protein